VRVLHFCLHFGGFVAFSSPQGTSTLLASQKQDTCSRNKGMQSLFSESKGLDHISYFLGLRARIARSLMTARRALVVPAVKHLGAVLLAGRALTVAALSVARVLATVPQPLALEVAGVVLGAGNLLPLSTAPAHLDDRLHAVAARAAVAALDAHMLVARQGLAAGVTTRGSGEGAREDVGALATRATTNFAQRANGA
jgi:hypothetical protein